MGFFCRLRIFLLATTVLVPPLVLAAEPIDLNPFTPADPHQQKHTHPTRGYLAPPTDTHETQPIPKEPLDLTPLSPSDPDIRMDTIDQNWNIFAGLGYMASLDATKDIRFQATADPYHEEDLLSDPKQSTHLQYLIGLQRVFLIQNSLIQRFDIGPSIFYDPVTFSGQVYQYTVPTLPALPFPLPFPQAALLPVVAPAELLLLLALLAQKVLPLPLQQTRGSVIQQ